MDLIDDALAVLMPRLGLGCAALGNLFDERTDEEVHDVLQAAWDAGIRLFDTAPHYGLGLSETRVGRFLADKPRDEFIVSTKVGRLIRDNPAWDGSALDDQGFAVPASHLRVLDYSRDGVRASVEDSLERLGLDRIDVLYVHDPEVSEVPGAHEQALAALVEMRAEGLTSAIGTGSSNPDALRVSAETGLADLLMVANRYTLLDQSVAPEVLDACAEHGVSIVAAAVFNSGLLASRPSREATFNYGNVPEPVFGRALAIDEVCARHGVEIAVAALHYPLLDPRVDSVVVGAASAAQVRENVARLEVEVPHALWDDLADCGLVPRCA